MILITGSHKAFALHKAIEEGVSHMWTVSAFQQHAKTTFVCDEDATLELRVKTVRYFKGLMYVHNKLVEDKKDETSEAKEWMKFLPPVLAQTSHWMRCDRDIIIFIK